MSTFLKQSTIANLKVGPFLDATDGYTPESGLSIVQSDIQLSKNGAAFAQTSEGSPSVSHDVDGWYAIPLTASDTDTLGSLTLQISLSGVLPIWENYMIVNSNSYNSLFGTENLNVNIQSIYGNEDSASNLSKTASTIVQGYAGNGTSAIFNAYNIHEATADHYNGRVIIFTSGALQYQATDITDYELVNGFGQFTVTAMTEAPASGDPFVIV